MSYRNPQQFVDKQSGQAYVDLIKTSIGVGDAMAKRAREKAKANEKEINVIKVNPNSSSITCPLCGFKSKKNRLNVSTFRCVRCGFEFDAQFVACLNLLSRADDGRLAIRHGRLFIHEAGYVVPVDVAPDEPLMRWLREKPVLILSKKSVV